MLLGHFPTKRAANMAIDDDIFARRKSGVRLEYLVEEVTEELTQAQIDEIFRKKRLEKIRGPTT
jgi:hypothetical protein